MEASLYTIADVARILDQKYQKIHRWTKPLHLQSTARQLLHHELGVNDTKLIVIKNAKKVFSEIVEDFLKKIEYSEDGYANRIQLVKYKKAEVVVDPTMSFGQPIFAASGVRVQDVVERLRTGEPKEEVAEDFHTPRSHIEEAWELANAKAA